MTDLTPAQRRSQRIAVTVTHSVFQRLVHHSNQQGRSISNLAAYLIERGLERGDLS